MGGNELPMAFTAKTIVTVMHLSPDVALPTCFFPFSAMIFVGF